LVRQNIKKAIEIYMSPDKSSCDYFGYDNSTNFHCELCFHRAANHHVLFIILPNIIFTNMSLGQFYFDFVGGKRLSYSVTILLIVMRDNCYEKGLIPRHL
jgi:hypothetical protein